MMEQDISLKILIFKIKSWYVFLLTKWKVITIASILGATLGFTYSYFKKTTYTANLTFALEEKGAGSNGIGAIASQFGFSLGGSEGGAFNGDNLIELFKSRFIIEKTLLSNIDINGKTDLLVNRYIEYNKINEDWANNANLKSLSFNTTDRSVYTKSHDSILGIIYNSIVNDMLLVNKVDKKLSIVKVSTTSEDEIFSKIFTENIVKNVSDFYVETKTSKSRNNIALLEYRVDSVRKELDAAMYGRAQFSDQNMGLVRQSAAVPKVRQEMKVQMLSTMYGELIKNLEFSKLALMREEPLIQIIDIPRYPLEANKVSKIKSGIITAFLFAFFTVIYLILSYIIKESINN